MKIIFILMLLYVAAQPRRVLLFYKDTDDQILTKQQAELEANKAGILERDIRIESYEFSKHAGDWKQWKVDTSAYFTFILVGRDGGEKYRSQKFVSHQDLFRKIDAMPMRRNEVK